MRMDKAFILDETITINKNIEEASLAFIDNTKEILRSAIKDPRLKCVCVKHVDDIYLYKNLLGRKQLLRWAFRKACNSGNFTIVKLMLARGENCDQEDGDKKAPLVAAAESGSYKVVRELLRSGAYINCHRKGVGRPLHTALKRGLLSEDCITSDNWDRTVIVSIEVVELLVEFGAHINCRCADGYLPLSLAVAAKRIDVVRYLLGRGACVNNKDDNLSRTPLMHAVEPSMLNIAKLLLFYGADVNMVDSFGYTPLLLAAKSGNLKLVELLSLKGADINWASPRDHRTALILATESGCFDMVELLLDLGADPYYSHDGLHRGKSALDIAHNMDLVEIEQLISLFANQNSLDKTSDTQVSQYLEILH